jgi:tetratricopeptide (TPR) repeat protein
MNTIERIFLDAQNCHPTNDLPRAEQLYQEVVRQEPGHWPAWFHLGLVQETLGKLPEAEAALNQLLRLRPDHVEGLVNLGIVLARQGKREAGVERLQQALRLQPGHAKALNNLGVALAELDRRPEAIAAWQESLRAQPDYAEAHMNLAVALSGEGSGARGQGSAGEIDEAEAHYREAIRLKPDYVQALSNLGLLLAENGRPGEAVVLLQQAVRLNPDFGDAHNNLGLALVDMVRPEEGVQSHDRALRLRPMDGDLHNNMGTAQAALGRLDEALASYQMALWLNPNHAEARWNRALALLQMGNYEDGWAEYEWRWRRKRARPRSFVRGQESGVRGQESGVSGTGETVPLWDGSSLEGKTILLYCEQGLGDTLQFVRYARQVKEKGGTVVLECLKDMAPILSTCPGIDHVVPEGSPLPAFDVQAPLMSLPYVCKTRLESIPGEVPYLFADAELVEKWRKEFSGPKTENRKPKATDLTDDTDTPALKIGIAWQGNPKHRWDRHRSFPVELFAPLSRLPGVQLYSLQKGPGSEQLAAVHWPLTTIPGLHTFRDTAAVIQCLDLVITCDSAVAHLAGALGVQVWVALAWLTDWRWFLKREDSPWYPTMRLFRQKERGNWEEVFARIKGEVEMVRGSLPGLRPRVGSRNGVHVK